MSTQENDELQISAMLAMAEVLARSSGLEMIAGGSGQKRPDAAGFLAGHQFAVCSLDRALDVQVTLIGATPDDVLVVLRSPEQKRGERRPVHVLKASPVVSQASPSAGPRRWVWQSGEKPLTPGQWWLELCFPGEPRRRSLTWAYQVFGRSSLRAELQLGQRVATGTELRCKVALSGPSTPTITECVAKLRTPAASPNAMVAKLHATSPALRAALARQAAEHWPNDRDRPWWRLRREHKQAALVAAKLVDARSAGVMLPPNRERVEERPDGRERRVPRPEAVVKISRTTNSNGYDLGIDGAHTRAAGTYAVLAKVRGRIGTEGDDIFERVMYRQVFVVPEADLSHCVASSWSRKSDGKLQRGVNLALWDAHGNPVLLEADAEVRLGEGKGKLRREDGKLSWTVDADARDSTRVALTLREKPLAGSLEVPLIDDRGFEGEVHAEPGRLSREALRIALDPRIASEVLDIRRREALVVRPTVDRGVKFVSVFSDSPTAYAVAVLREDGKVETVGTGRGARRFAVKLRAGESVQLRSMGGEGEPEFALSGLRFD